MEDTMPRLILIVVAALALGFAPVPFPKPPSAEADLKAMQGDWVDEKFHPRWGGVIFRFNGAKLEIIPIYGVRGDFTVTLNASVYPKCFDYREKGSRLEDTYRGIYRIDKDTLTICTHNYEKVRPRSFEDAPKISRVVLKRYCSPLP
jgi:uncharacterized protein (TIGR03067 family)